MQSDRMIRIATTGAVVLVGGIAAFASYGHMRAVAQAHGETGWTAALLPLSVDGLILAASMTLLADSRAGRPAGRLPWVLLVLGSVASLAANVIHGDPTVTGRVIAAWPPVALVGAYEMLMRQLRARAAKNRTAEVAETEPEEPPAPSENGEPADALLGYARRVAAEHRDRHGGPITTEALRARLGVSSAVAARLHHHLGAGQTAA